MNEPMHDLLYSLLKEKLNTSSLDLHPIGGGSINETFKITAGPSSYFLKLNSASKFPHLFQKEARGLRLLEKQKCIRTARVIDIIENGQQLLLLDWIEPGERNNSFWKSFGEQLAALHHKTNDLFGLEEDNYMGSVHQNNSWEKDWKTFFIHKRLEPLVNECLKKGLLNPAQKAGFERIYERLEEIIEPEAPALIHGDLWNGNFMCDSMAAPVLIDPAVYYGHRSMDIGMSRLFGGFARPFYEAYHHHFPLPTNYEEQCEISNLYPLLIHLLLFGRSYLYDIEKNLKRFE